LGKRSSHLIPILGRRPASPAKTPAPTDATDGFSPSYSTLNSGSQFQIKEYPLHLPIRQTILQPLQKTIGPANTPPPSPRWRVYLEEDARRVMITENVTTSSIEVNYQMLEKDSIEYS
jgi:hypothetical protein